VDAWLFVGMSVMTHSQVSGLAQWLAPSTAATTTVAPAAPMIEMMVGKFARHLG
jgi:hypothetical protein